MDLAPDRLYQKTTIISAYMALKNIIEIMKNGTDTGEPAKIINNKTNDAKST